MPELNFESSEIISRPTPRVADEVHQALMEEYLADVTAAEDTSLSEEQIQQFLDNEPTSRQEVADYAHEYSKELLTAARADKAQHELEKSNPNHGEIIEEHDNLMFEYQEMIKGQQNILNSLPRYLAEITRLSAPGENQDLSTAAYYQGEYDKLLEDLKEYPSEIEEALNNVKVYYAEHQSEVFSDALIEAALDGKQINHPNSIDVDKS